MNSVKFLVLITIGILLKNDTTAQVKLSLIDNSIKTEMERVVKDYFNQFVNIRGEAIAENPQTTDYKSMVSLKGSEECSITKYSSTNNNIWSWQAVMLTTEEFSTAKRSFQTLYYQLNDLSVNFEAHSGCLFKGKYAVPSEEKKFTSVVFSADSKDETLKPLKIELTLQHKIVEWEVKILVYGKEREDNEPAVKEGEK